MAKRSLVYRRFPVSTPKPAQKAPSQQKHAESAFLGKRISVKFVPPVLRPPPTVLVRDEPSEKNEKAKRSTREWKWRKTRRAHHARSSRGSLKRCKSTSARVVCIAFGERGWTRRGLTRKLLKNRLERDCGGA